MKVKVKVQVTSDSLRTHGLYSPWNSPGQNTGVGSLSLLLGLFPTQGSNPGLPHCWWILYQLSHKGSPRILEWVAFPFSCGSSWPRNQTGVFCIVEGLLDCCIVGFFTNWAIRKAHFIYSSVYMSIPVSQLIPLPFSLGNCKFVGKVILCRKWGEILCRWGKSRRCPLSESKNLFLDTLAKTYLPLTTQLVKNPPAMQETLVWFLSQEDPLEKG